MPRGYPVMLLTLAFLWGSSFLFIEVALDDVEPPTMMALRLFFGAAALVPVLMAQRGARGAVGDLRAAGRPLWVLGIVNAAVPFTLIAWGQQYIDSGIAAIANASVPIFVVLLAIHFRPSERVTGLRLAGLVAGFVGVAVLTGGEFDGSWSGVAGTLAVVTASLLYASGALYAQTHVAQVDSIVLATGSAITGTLVLTPLALAQLPSGFPSWETWASVAVLGLGGMAAGQLLYYVVIDRYGSTRASLVTYLLPVIALILGALILDEPVELTALLGLVLILSGVAFGSGLVKPVRRRQVAAPVSPAP
jgi:drug/metabolite transporter (DMT)-like permease